MSGGGTVLFNTTEYSIQDRPHGHRSLMGFTYYLHAHILIIIKILKFYNAAFNFIMYSLCYKSYKMFCFLYK